MQKSDFRRAQGKNWLLLFAQEKKGRKNPPKVICASEVAR